MSPSWLQHLSTRKCFPPRVGLLFITLFLFLITVSTVKAALPSFTDSIELRIANCDCALIGHIIKVESAIPPGGTITGPWSKVTVHTDQPLVAAVPDGDIIFWAESATWYSFTAEDTQKLFILDHGSRYASASAIYARIPLTLQKIGFMSDVELPTEISQSTLNQIPTMTLHPFTSLNQLLAAVKPYCDRPLAPLREEPLSTQHAHAWGWVLFVPVDSNTELLAHIWIRSSDPEQKWNGVRVLRWIKSPQNAELLKLMAQLPPTDEQNETIREMAIRALASWGIPISPFPRFEKVPWPETLAVHFWVSLLILIAVPTLYWRKQKKKTSSRLLWRTCVAFWLLSITVVTILWARSYLELDGLCGSDWQFGAINGQLFAAHPFRNEGNVDWPWEYCRPSVLPEVRKLPDLDWSWYWNYPERFFWDGWGTTSWLEDTRPGWAVVLVYRMPIWLLEIALIAPAILLQTIKKILHAYQNRRARNRSGFPVEPLPVAHATTAVAYRRTDKSTDIP